MSGKQECFGVLFGFPLPFWAFSFFQGRQKKHDQFFWASTPSTNQHFSMPGSGSAGEHEISRPRGMLWWTQSPNLELRHQWNGFGQNLAVKTDENMWFNYLESRDSPSLVSFDQDWVFQCFQCFPCLRLFARGHSWDFAHLTGFEFAQNSTPRSPSAFCEQRSGLASLSGGPSRCH